MIIFSSCSYTAKCAGLTLPHGVILSCRIENYLVSTFCFPCCFSQVLFTCSVSWAMITGGVRVGQEASDESGFCSDRFCYGALHTLLPDTPTWQRPCARWWVVLLHGLPVSKSWTVSAGGLVNTAYVKDKWRIRKETINQKVVMHLNISKCHCIRSVILRFLLFKYNLMLTASNRTQLFRDDMYISTK